MEDFMENVNFQSKSKESEEQELGKKIWGEINIKNCKCLELMN